MSRKKNPTIAICLNLSDSDLGSQPVASFAQATSMFSGEAVALRASAAGISLALSDTGALPSSGGESEYVSGKPQCLGLGSALHVKGPSIDIVVASAQSGITCS